MEKKVLILAAVLGVLAIGLYFFVLAPSSTDGEYMATGGGGETSSLDLASLREDSGRSREEETDSKEPSEEIDSVVMPPSNTPGRVTKIKAKKEAPSEREYAEPTLQSLSHLYWALSKFTADNNAAIDDFLLINECDLYRDYHQNEFEWSKIRDEARKRLVQGKKDFTTRLEFVQPLRLAEYDLEKQIFDVWKPFKIDSTKNFEVLISDYFDEVCGYSGRTRFLRYPKGLYVELNRPFRLNNIPVAPEAAEVYIRKQNDDIRRAGGFAKGRKELYSARDAYLVMRIRVFGYKEDVLTQHNDLAKVVAVLESYHIYGDPERTILLYERDYNRKNIPSTKEVEIKIKFKEQLKEKLKGFAAAKAKEKAENL